MSEESKDKGKFEFPMMPIYGVDLGERLGSLAEGLRRLDARMDRFEVRLDALEAKIDAVDAKLDAKIDAVDSRVDKCLVAINRLDERTQMQGRLLLALGGGTLAAVIAGIVIQLSR